MALAVYFHPYCYVTPSNRRGYRVHVVGGHVTSKPNASELTIVATRTTHSVSVVLRPGH